MKIELKKRISTIKKGKIPDGYKVIEGNILPEDWELEKLGNIVERIVGGGTPSRNKAEYYGGDIPWATVKDLSESNYKDDTIEYITEKGLKNSSAKLIEQGCFIISTRMGLGRGFINNVPMAINQDLKGIYVKKELIYIKFLMYWYKSLGDYIGNLGGGSTVKGINLNTLKNLKIRLMSYDEQQKIAEILLTWDKAIELIEKLIEEKKKHKKGLMQKLLTGEMRLPDFDGEWKMVKIGNVLKERNETGFNDLELLSITSKNGIVRRTEVDIKDNSSNDKSKYKRICIDDIGYNTMRMWQGVSGVSNYEGIVSPAYTIIKPNGKVDSTYIGYLFKLPKVINAFWRYSQGLVSDTLNLKYANLKIIKIRIPCDVYEQKAIARILSTADKEIDLLQQELDALKLQKKGLLQLLLTGIVRVNIEQN